jgi:hypothetical protein
MHGAIEGQQERVAPASGSLEDVRTLAVEAR